MAPLLADGSPSLLGGVLGGVLSGVLPKRFLLAAIAVVVLFGAYEISRRDRFANAGEDPRGGVGVAIAFAVGVLGGHLVLAAEALLG